MLEQLAEQTAGIPVCVVLTDDRARLLLRLDTTTAIGRVADGNDFAEGFGYDESAVGPLHQDGRHLASELDLAQLGPS